MERFTRLEKEDEQIELPPGFRFHPTDEELITHYLSEKVLDNTFCAKAIGEVDLNKCEPWDLPWRAKMGEKEWYFFCLKDRKYPTGLRTNRATDAGYWKATGKDKEIINRGKTQIGKKKTLVFYRGRAPKGEKTNWVMHEYRIEGKFSADNLPKTAKNEWVLCRVFQKSSSGKKAHISGLVKLNSNGDQKGSSLLPPLLDSSPFNSKSKAAFVDSSHVTCFSDPLEDHKSQCDMVENFDTPFLASSSSSSNPAKTSPSSSYYSPQIASPMGNTQYPDGFFMQDQSILKMLFESQGPNTKSIPKEEISQEEIVHGSMEDEGYYSSNQAGPIDIGCLWNY